MKHSNEQRLQQMKEVFKKKEDKIKEDMDIIEEAFVVDDKIIVSMRKQIEDYENILKGIANGIKRPVVAINAAKSVLEKWKRKLKNDPVIKH